jgi:hypothetical protein
MKKEKAIFPSFPLAAPGGKFFSIGQNKPEAINRIRVHLCPSVLELPLR